MITESGTPAVLECARALVPAVAASAEESERLRRLSPAIARQLADAGLFRMLVASEFGGAQVDAATAIRVIEEVSRADAAAGWCVMIAATTGLMSAYLPEPTAAEIFAPEDSITGGVLNPRGRATRVDGGYRLSGRWPFVSGSQHCTWLCGGATVHNDAGPVFAADGIPEVRVCFFPASDAKVIDTWSVSGLRGTGSHDMELDNIFVPAARTTLLGGARPWHTGTVYHFPMFGLLALGVSAVGLGLARASIDELMRVAVEKVPTGSSKTLAARDSTHASLATAEALLRSARALVFETIDEVSRAVERGERPSLDQRARIRIAATNAALSSARCVDLMYNLGGATSIYDASPLQRHFRDVHVVTQHVMVQPITLEMAGRVLLGLPTETALL